MKYAFLIIIMIFLLSGHITAQTNCDLVPCVDVEVSWEDFDYDTGCFTGYQCGVSENLYIYQLAVAVELSSVCAEDDLFCRNEAFFRTIAASIYDNPLVTTAYRQPPTEVKDAWAAFTHQDYEQALALLSGTNSNIYNTYLKGLTYELLDQPHEALSAYDTVLTYYEHDLLTIYTQGLLYGREGRTIEASFVSAWLEDYFIAFAPDLLHLPNTLTSRYPLDTSRITYWNKYLISYEFSTPGPVSFVDLTRTAPIPVQLSWYDELNVILATDLIGLQYPQDTGDVVNTLVLWQQDEQNYRHPYEFGIEDVTTQMYLEFKDGYVWGHEGLGYAGSHEFILMPADQNTDPRSGFGEPACEGGVISRLRPGMRVGEMSPANSGLGYVENPGDELDHRLRFDDGDRGDYVDETFAGVVIRVTDKNLCIGDELWWEVTDSAGTYGWRAENIGTEYQFEPRIDLQDLFYCPNIPRTRLFREVEGRVLPGLGGNHLRVEPGVESALVGTMAEGDTFTVLQGPTCADNMAWWQVQYGDLTGWTAEGQGDTYWLEPIMPWQ